MTAIAFFFGGGGDCDDALEGPQAILPNQFLRLPLYPSPLSHAHTVVFSLVLGLAYSAALGTVVFVTIVLGVLCSILAAVVLSSRTEKTRVEVRVSRGWDSKREMMGGGYWQ